MKPPSRKRANAVADVEETPRDAERGLGMIHQTWTGIFCGAFITVSACGMDTIQHGNADAGPSGADATAMDASPGPDTGVDGGAADASAEDATVPTDAGFADAGRLAEVASIQTITYRLHNQTTSDVFVVIDGWDCTPFHPGFPTRLSFQCGCECPPPPDPAPTRFVRIAPDGRYDLEWDGRGLVTWTEPEVCGPDFTIDLTYGVLVPVEPISAPTRIAYETKLPDRCSDGAGDVYECPPPETGMGPGAVISPLCETQFEVSVPLVLREGDITIDVPIR